MKKNYFFIFLLLLSSILNAQIKNLDSLKKALTLAKDTQRINILNELARQYVSLPPTGRINNHFIDAKKYAEEALGLSKSLKYSKGIGNAFFNIGSVSLKVSDENKQIKGLEAFQAALPISCGMILMLSMVSS